MAIGGALAAARDEAGLSIAEVSQRTRIREKIIRDIESDDYSSCGGDFYARGHIRAIARVVGADPVPLIAEYDTARLPRSDELAPPEITKRPRAEPDAAADPDLLLDAPARSPGISAAEAFRPRLPLEFERRRPGRAALLGLLAAAVIGVVLYLVLPGSAAPAHGRAHTPPPRGQGSAAAAAHRSAGATPAPSPTPTAAHLTVASAAAFGPGGTSTGDDPQDARLAIDASRGTGWHTDWYATARLGGLQSGTGLLLDLGGANTIRSATITLGSAPGGTIELRAGDQPTLAALPVVATVANPGGSLTVHLSAPVRARYLLIWFTSLPPDGAGTYEAWIYDVTVTGTR